VFEKKILEKMEKKSAELILEAMKAGPTQLARLRHPRLLVVQHPLEESRYEQLKRISFYISLF
jgi:SCY1-like protein 2